MSALVPLAVPNPCGRCVGVPQGRTIRKQPGELHARRTVTKHRAGVYHIATPDKLTMRKATAVLAELRLDSVTNPLRAVGCLV